MRAVWLWAYPKVWEVIFVMHGPFPGLPWKHLIWITGAYTEKELKTMHWKDILTEQGKK